MATSMQYIMNKKLLSILLSLLIIVYFTIFLIPIDTNYIFNSDSLHKLIQTYSVIQNHYLSDKVFYPFFNIDPEYKFHFSNTFSFSHNGNRYIQYPALFAYLNAPFLQFFGEGILIWITLLFGFLTGLILFKTLRLSIYSIMFLFFSTPLVFYGYEYSENTIFLFVSFLGLSITIKDNFESSKFIQILTALLFLIAIHLRIEAIVFVPIYFLIYVILKISIEKVSFYKLIKILFPFGITFGLLLISWFIFNKINYGHFLGPRFIISGKNEWDIIIKLKQMFVLFFFGKGKVGFFGYMPLILYLIFFYIVKSRIQEKPFYIKLSFYTIIVYLPLISFLTGSEAFVNWGPRYLALAIFPSIILVDDYVKNYVNKNKNNLIIFLILSLYGFYITHKGIQITIHSYHMMKDVHQQILNENENYDLILVDDHYLSGFLGRDLYRKKVLIIDDFDSFLSISQNILQDSNYKKILLIATKLKKGDLDEIWEPKDYIDRFLLWVTTRKYANIKRTKEDLDKRAEYYSRNGFIVISSNPFFSKMIKESKI